MDSVPWRFDAPSLRRVPATTYHPTSVYVHPHRVLTNAEVEEHIVAISERD